MKTEFQANQALSSTAANNSLIAKAFASKMKAYAERQAVKQAGETNKLSFTERLALIVGA